MIYNKEVQTAEVATDPIVLPAVEVVQQRISREQQEAEKAAARDKELEEETVQLEKEIEEEIRGKTYFPDNDMLVIVSSNCRANGGRARGHLCRTGIH